MGASCWELYCLEHNIAPDGKLLPSEEPKDGSVQKSNEKVSKFFMRIKTNFYLKTNCLIIKKCREKQCKIALIKLTKIKI